MVDTTNTINDELKANIRQEASEAAYSTINSTMDKEREEAGKKWGGFAGIIMAILEWIDQLFGFKQGEGLTAWAAETFAGVKIPKEQEVVDVSHSVGNGVANALTNEIPFNNKEELIAGIEQQITAELNKDKSKFPALEGRIQELAHTAAVKTVEQQFSSMFDAGGNRTVPQQPGASPVQLLASGTMLNIIKSLDPERKQQVATLAGKSELNELDMLNLATTFGPAMAELQAKKEANQPITMEEISTALNEAIKKNRRNLQENGGLNFSDTGLQLLSVKLTTLAGNHFNITMDDTFKANVAEREDYLTKALITEQVKKMTYDSIVEKTALNALAINNSKWYYRTAFDDDAIKTMNEHYNGGADKADAKQYTLNPSNGYQMEDLKKAQLVLVGDVADKNKGFTEPQIELISEIVAETISKVTQDSTVTTENLQATIRSRVLDALKEQEEDISAIGNNIQKINKNLSEDNKPYDILQEIANGAAEKAGQNTILIDLVEANRKARLSSATNEFRNRNHTPTTPPDYGVAAITGNVLTKNNQMGVA